MGIRPEGRSGRKRLRAYLVAGTAVALAAGAAAGAAAASASTTTPTFVGYKTPTTVSKSLYLHDSNTATPIKHVVVIFDENESFDHYFGTYPYAANTDGTKFTAKPGTPTVNGLYTAITSKGPIGPLLTDNPNEFNPQRLTSAEAMTSDQNHGYTAEEEAADNGKMDDFVEDTQGPTTGQSGCQSYEYCPDGIVMDYYDGNTVTALWNYAQYYSMSDNNYDTAFGPSTPGAVNVTSGDTGGAEAFNPTWDPTNPSKNVTTTDSDIADVNSSTGLGVLYTDSDPYYDDCSDSNHTTDGPLAALTGENIGNLLNNAHVTWGWFQGGFAPTGTADAPGTSTPLPVCGSTHDNIGGAAVQDYVPHHDPFQFYASTANPAHLAPSSLGEIGYTDQANHQYDVSYFSDALSGTGGAQLPAVSYVKPPAYENAHPGNSDPTDEQNFVVNTVNSIEKSKYWDSTAIIITYDDSDGWYDSAVPPVINGSADSTNDTKFCSSVPLTVTAENDRCGYGQRLPMIVISPYTRENYVSSNQTDTTSVVKFIEDNWLRGERIPDSFDAVSGSLDAPGGLLDFDTQPHFQPLILNPSSGAVVSGSDFWGNDGLTKAQAEAKGLIKK
jgi:phospholipase C